MNRELSAEGLSTPTHWTIVCTRITIILLLFTVAGLATLAKNGQYLPEASPAQHVSIAIKMNVTHSSAHVAVEPLQPSLGSLLPPQPEVRFYRRRVNKPPVAIPIGVIVSMQYRAPPQDRV